MECALCAKHQTPYLNESPLRGRQHCHPRLMDESGGSVGLVFWAPEPVNVCFFGKRLCRCNEDKDLEVRSFGVPQDSPKANGKCLPEGQQEAIVL